MAELSCKRGGGGKRQTKCLRHGTTSRTRLPSEEAGRGGGGSKNSAAQKNGWFPFGLPSTISNLALAQEAGRLVRLAKRPENG